MYSKRFLIIATLLFIVIVIDIIMIFTAIEKSSIMDGDIPYRFVEGADLTNTWVNRSLKSTLTAKVSITKTP